MISGQYTITFTDNKYRFTPNTDEVIMNLTIPRDGMYLLIGFINSIDADVSIYKKIRVHPSGTIVASWFNYGNILIRPLRVSAGIVLDFLAGVTVSDFDLWKDSTGVNFYAIKLSD